MQKSRSKHVSMSYKCHTASLLSIFSASSPAIPHQQGDLPTFAWRSHELWHFKQGCFLWQECPFSPLLPGQVIYLSLRLNSNAITSLKYLLTELGATYTHLLNIVVKRETATEIPLPGKTLCLLCIPSPDTKSGTKQTLRKYLRNDQINVCS